MTGMPSIRGIHQNNTDVVVGITYLQNECCDGNNTHSYAGTLELKTKTKFPSCRSYISYMLNDYESFTAILV